MNAQACQRSSSSSSISSHTSVYHETFDIKETQDSDRRMSQDTIYSCDSAGTASVSSSEKTSAEDGPNTSISAMPSAFARSPPPRPSRHLRPPNTSTVEKRTGEKPKVAKPTESIRRWPLPPYCYDPFTEYDETNLSFGSNESCSRADSMHIDPGMLTVQFLNFQQGPSIDRFVPSAASTSRSVSNRGPNGPNLVLETSQRSQKALPKLPTEMPSPASLDWSAPITPSNDDMRSADARHVMQGIGTWGAGAVETPKLFGSAIKKLSAKASARLAAGKPNPYLLNRLRASEQQHKAEVAEVEPPRGRAKTLTSEVVHVVGRSDVTHGENTINLELPVYHRALRKQTYPPRVRYTDKSYHSLAAARPASSSATHVRRGSDEQFSYAPRPAFEYFNTSSLR